MKIDDRFRVVWNGRRDHVNGRYLVANEETPRQPPQDMRHEPHVDVQRPSLLKVEPQPWRVRRRGRHLRAPVTL